MSTNSYLKHDLFLPLLKNENIFFFKKTHKKYVTLDFTHKYMALKKSVDIFFSTQVQFKLIIFRLLLFFFVGRSEKGMGFTGFTKLKIFGGRLSHLWVLPSQSFFSEREKSIKKYILYDSLKLKCLDVGEKFCKRGSVHDSKDLNNCWVSADYYSIKK